MYAELTKQEAQLVLALYEMYEHADRHAADCECCNCECYDAVGNTNKSIHDSLWEKIKDSDNYITFNGK